MKNAAATARGWFRFLYLSLFVTVIAVSKGAVPTTTTREREQDGGTTTTTRPERRTSSPPTPSPTYEQLQSDWEAATGRVYSETSDYARRIQTELHHSQRRFQQRLLKDVFDQRVGWNRFRHSLRDTAGLLLGCWMVFRGYSHPQLAQGGAVALQSAQLSWHVLRSHQVLPHAPWLCDAVSAAVAFVTWKKLPASVAELFRARLPPLFLAMSLFQCWGLVIAQWQHEEKIEAPPFLSIVLAVALSFVGLRAGQIPLALAASSLSGALLVYDSVRAEIAGNWIYMLEIMARLSYPVIRFGQKVIGGSIKWLWKNIHVAVSAWKLVERIKHPANQCQSGIQKVALFVWHPMNKLQSYVRNLPLTKRLQLFLKRLQKALGPVLWPWGIATWGVAVQMNKITDLGGALRVLMLTIDPVSFVVGNLKDFFDVNSRARKAIVSFSRSLLALAIGKIKSEETSPSSKKKRQ